MYDSRSILEDPYLQVLLLGKRALSEIQSVGSRVALSYTSLGPEGGGQ